MKKILCFSLFLWILTSCHMTKYTAVRSSKSNETFINPPSPHLFKRLGLKENGDWSGKIGYVHLNIKNVQSNDSNSPFKKLKVDYKTKAVDTLGNLILNVNAYLKRDGNIDIYSRWDYGSLYNEDLNEFNYEKFVNSIDALRLFLDYLENPEQTDSTSTSIEIIHPELVHFKMIRDKDSNTKLKKGSSQKIINTFFQYLVLPNSCSLYNYGYLPPEILKKVKRSRYLYFLDEEMGLNTIVNTVVKDSCEKSKNRALFASNLSTHFALQRDEKSKLFFSSHFNNTSSESCDLSPYLSTPIDFNKPYKYVAIHSDGEALRGSANTSKDDSFRQDLNLIVCDSLSDFSSLFLFNEYQTNETLIKININDLKRKKQLYYIKRTVDGESLYDRTFYSPTLKTFHKTYSISFVEYLPLGRTIDNVKIERWRGNKYFKVVNKKNKISLLINQKDIITYGL